MTIKIDATIRNGHLETKEPVPLAEGTLVTVEIRPAEEDNDPFEAVIGSCDGPPDGAANHDQYLYGDRRS